ncbi:MAG: aminodeoxychorismate/anthranilate synthase component II [Phreatobacter sp.]|nr:aminodeoxychorismate/anthranilate synthase component II [Phreatobacter sp.]
MKITLIDNYDSFTWNLVHYIGGQEIGGVRPEVQVIRNDKTTADAVIASDPDAIVLSPGPCTPNEAGICLDLIGKASETIPMFGVCLGHQAMGQVFGGHVVRAPKPMHGKMSTIAHNGRSVFRGINGDFQATRYHSLTVDRATWPDDLEITAESEDGVVQGLMHRSRPVHGVQFHPESIASEHGHRMIATFLDLAATWNRSQGRR